MLKKHTVPTFLPILFLALLTSGCSDDTSSPKADSDVLLTLHFDEYFFPQDNSTNLVFASTPDGALLDVGSWTGEATVILKNEEIHPETVSLTYAITFGDNGYYMITEMGLEPGSVKSFHGTAPPQ